MKKYILRTVVVWMAWILLISGLPVMAGAETQDAELFTLDAAQNMGISVAYDKEPPSVEFIAPDGAIYGSQAVADGRMTRTDTGSALYFRIPNAQAGTWQIRYDKKSNSELEVNYGAYAISLKIEEFSYLKKNDDTLDVQFSVSHDNDMRFSYAVYAVVLENGTVVGQKELQNGYARANEQGQITVSLDGLGTYSTYQLMLEVSAQDNGVPVFDSAVTAETFAYTDPDAPEAPENFYLEINADDGALLIRWEDTKAEGKETLAAVYINGGAEPAYYNTFPSNIRVTEIPMDMDTAKEVRVELSYKGYRDETSQIAARTVDLAVASAVSLRCEDITTKAQAEVVYQLEDLAGGPFAAVLTVNGVAQELSLQGNDTFSVQLQAFENEVELLWYYDANTAFRLGKELYFDRLAPSLNIADGADRVITDQPTYILTGSVDVGCAVTVNGTEIEVDANGIFTTKLSLEAGENSFSVVATGPNGNKTQQTVVVEWAESAIIQTAGKYAVWLQYIPLAAGVLLSVVLSLFIIGSGKRFRKIRDEKGTKAAVLAVGCGSAGLLIALSALATACFAALWIYINTKLNSVEFYDLVISSGMEEAYSMIRTRNGYRLGTLISGGCVVVSMGLCILLNRLSQKESGKKEETDE